MRASLSSPGPLFIDFAAQQREKRWGGHLAAANEGVPERVASELKRFFAMRNA
jgi:hypothetical protein